MDHALNKSLCLPARSRRAGLKTYSSVQAEVAVCIICRNGPSGTTEVSQTEVPQKVVEMDRSKGEKALLC